MKKLSWDSIFFKKNIYTFEDISELDKFLLEKNEIIQKKIKKEDGQNKQELLKMGFEFIEGEITFIKNLDIRGKEFVEERNIIKASLKDFEKIKEIIKDSYKYSRFNKIEPSKVNEFYYTWVKNAILGKFDDFCLILQENQQIIGFITLKLINENSARVGLVGVDKRFRGKNIGSKLIKESERLLFLKKIKKLYISTQSSNREAIKLYLKNEFKLESEDYWFYKIGGENND